MRLRGCLFRVATGLLLVLAVAFAVAWFRSDNTCDHPAAAAPEGTMKALTYCDYGTAEVLRVEDVAKPVPADGEILVRVRAAAVNPLDWHFIRGTPYLMRLGAGLRKPKVTRLGVDFAGTVEAVGPRVTRFQPGDEVFGGRTGAFAEYVTVGEDKAIARKPPNLTFEEAAAVPIAAVTALQALRDKGKVAPGQTVLVNGASGGVGTFAVQIAKSFGARVTAVCSGKNAALVRSLGAEDVVDYTKEDFTRTGKRYDVILDLVGNRTLSDLRRALQPKGICVLSGGGGPNDGRWIGPLVQPVKAILLSPFVSQKIGMFLAELRRSDLDVLAGLLAEGKVKPVIDRRYPLRDAASAIRYLEEGHAKGKVVLDVDEAMVRKAEK